MSDPGDSTPGWAALAPPLDPPTDGGVPLAVAQGIADQFWPDHPYLTWGLMWEYYALMQPPVAAVASINTGVQSVAYTGGQSPYDTYMARAQVFFDRAMGNLVSVPLTVGYPDVWGPLRDMSWWIDP
jgi:hypothetical protein